MENEKTAAKQSIKNLSVNSASNCKGKNQQTTGTGSGAFAPTHPEPTTEKNVNVKREQTTKKLRHDDSMSYLSKKQCHLAMNR